MSGAKIRVAAIDSGVNPAHPHIGQIAGGVAVNMEGMVDPANDAWIDKLGHGTAVMAAIQQGAPAADFFAVKVFHDALQTRAVALVRAIDWCLSQNIDVINLSLGTVNPSYIEAFADAVERCVQRGTVIVAAREANGTPCYPGSLPGVISVGLDWDTPRATYRCEEKDGAAVFFTAGYPRPIPGVSPSRNLYGISFAVANMTGFVLRARAAVEPTPLHQRFTAVQRHLQKCPPEAKPT